MQSSLDAARLSQVVLSALFVLAYGFTVPTRRRDAAAPWRTWLKRGISLIPEIALFSLSLSALVACLIRRKADVPRHDVLVLASLIVSSIISIIDALFFFAATALRLVYYSAILLTWSLAYPILPWSTAFSIAIPSLVLLCSAAILADPPTGITHDNGHPLTDSSVVSYLTVSWLTPLLRTAASRAISVDDTPHAGAKLSARHALMEDEVPAVHEFRYYGIDKGMIRFIAGFCPGPLSVAVVLSLFDVGLQLLGPFILQTLLQSREPVSVVALLFTSIAQAACAAHATLQMRRVAIRMRSGLTALVCDRTLRLPGRGKTETIEPSVLLEVDILSIFYFIERMSNVWVVPLQLVLSAVALVYILNWQSVLAGAAATIFFVPLYSYCTAVIGRQAMLLMAAKDSRITVIKECLARVKHIKLYWWQSAFETKVAEAREHELTTFLGLAVSEAFLTGIAVLMPMTMTVACLGTYMALGGLLESSRVFPALVILLAVGRGLNIIPLTMILYGRGAVSYGRIRSFLLGNEYDAHELIPSNARQQQGSVTIHGATFGIPSDAEGERKTILEDVSLEIAPTNLVVVTGPVGSGKTTIARAILGDISPEVGQVEVHGRIAYVPQRPFLINGTIRENILFGLPLDPTFYERVLDAVCLRPDLTQLPHGDATMLGGVGPSLSGGQQSRVSLARAVYSRRDIMILDDPLAAVDAKVQRKLIDKVLGPDGILKDTIRFVTTSNDALMRAADKLYLIKDMRIGEVTPSAVQSPALDPAISTVSREDADPALELPQQADHGYGTMPLVSFMAVAPTDTGDSGTNETTALVVKTVESNETPAESGSGSVKWATYKSYLQTGKPWGWPLVVLLAAISVLLNTLGVYFLKESSEEFERYRHSSKLWFYAFCGVVGAIVEMIFIATAYYRCLIPASQALHADLTHGVLRSKFTFFDKTPMGQILNRFTNDINQIDGPVSGGFILLVINTIAVLSSLMIIVVTSPISTLPLVPLAVTYFFIQKFYMDTCRQLRRLENHARGPILNTIGEITTGASVIQAYEQEALFQNRSRHMIDEHVRIWVPFLSLEPWLLLRLQLLSCVVQAFSAGSLLYLQASSATLGLVMSFVLQITTQLNTVVTVRANLEASLTSLERISAYALSESEEDQDDEQILQSNWPAIPNITFESYSAAHKPGAPPCLRDIDLSIQAFERVAVIGRTGAGKSSLILALMRALDQKAVQSGRIRIDGVDIATVRLADLRRRIAIVPQEPIVFTGTLRENLDPSDERTDDELAEVMGRCSLARMVGIDKGSEEPLEYMITDGGKNLSSGQIQLLAIARAILNPGNIVILDEATAAVDAETRTVINEVMKDAFRGRTVLTIAHHIESILHYDRILVLDHGRVAEFDEPAILFQDTNSAFAQFVKEAELEKTARELYIRKVG